MSIKKQIVSVDGAHYMDKPIIKAIQKIYLNSEVNRNKKMTKPFIVLFSLFGKSNLHMKGKHRIMLCGEPNSTRHEHYDIIVDCKIVPQLRRGKAFMIYYPFYVWSFSERFHNFPRDLLEMTAVPSSDQLRQKRFCAFMYRHDVGHRNTFFRKLSTEYKRVDALGQCCNNTPEASNDRNVYQPGVVTYNDLAVKKYHNYKFVIAIENTVGLQGYITEKLVNPMLAGAIPIYWGAPDVVEHFNENSFINVNTLGIEGAIREIMRLDEDDEAYRQMIGEKWFVKNELPEYFGDEYLENALRVAFKTSNGKV